LKEGYVHGYQDRENVRLYDQANALTNLLHGDTLYPAGSHILEAGCGVGAQSVILAKNSPQARFTSVDVSEASLAKAAALIEQEGIRNVTFEQGDIFNLTYPQGTFDHVFVCFVLEHLSAPLEALKSLKSVVKEGGTITVIEGDHGSTYFHPHSEDAMRAVACLVEAQARLKGNSLIGRQLYPLLKEAGYKDARVSPRMVYVDSSRPELVEGFTRNTFTAMVEGVRDQALSMGLIDEKTWDKGIADLYRTAEDDGVFCYTFFKGVAVK
jgi:ubiquinone/menaquinone biosynthesis C-methylase UbiE